MIEHGLWLARHIEISRNRGLDLFPALRDELFLVGFGPPILVGKIGPQARQRLVLPVRHQFFRGDNARHHRRSCGRPGDR